MLPVAGDAIELDGFRFEIAEVLDRRIARVTISRIELAPIEEK
jgi:CBS domain containing-hemolysin-like protein